MVGDGEGNGEQENEGENAETLAEFVREISMVTHYTPVSIRATIEAGELNEALLLTATRCEQVLAELVKQRFDLTDEQFDNLGWERNTLGWFYNVCRETDVEVVCDYESEIGEFIGKRNNLAHKKGYFEEVQQNHEGEREKVKELVIEVTAFLEDASDVVE